MGKHKDWDGAPRGPGCQVIPRPGLIRARASQGHPEIVGFHSPSPLNVFFCERPLFSVFFKFMYENI